MSDTKDKPWTAGPWVLSPNREHVRRTLHGFNVCALNDCLDEREANARLIAQAPALVEALEDLVAGISAAQRPHSCVGFDCATCTPSAQISNARAVLARCYGEGEE